MRINLSVTNGEVKVEASYVTEKQPRCFCGMCSFASTHTVTLKVNRKDSEFAGRYVRTIEVSSVDGSTTSNQVVINVPGVNVDTEFADSEAHEVLAQVPGLIGIIVQKVPFEKLAPVAHGGSLIDLAAQFAAAKANANKPKPKFDAEGYNAEGNGFGGGFSR